MDAVLAIDQGTTATTALVVGADRRVAAKASVPTPLSHPRPGWAESDPMAILDATARAVTGALAGAAMGRVDAIGITNQRETTVLWDRATLRPLTAAVSWQDRRTADLCRSLRAAEGVEALVRQRTGLVLDPYFSGTKIRWLLDHHPELSAAAGRGDVAFGTIDTWLVANLTGEHVTDPSNASRTLLLDIGTGAWDGELAEAIGVPPEVLPRVVRSSGPVAAVGKATSLGTRLSSLVGVPVAGIAGDQQAALFGHGCLRPGQAKGTLGTGAFFLANAGPAQPRPPPGILATVAWDIGDGLVYALEGASFSCGSALEWLSRVGLLDSPAGLDAAARGVPDAGGVAFVPALYGLAAPEWDPDARGAFVGLSAGTTRAHLARAVGEGLAAQNVLLLDALAAGGRRLSEIRLDGGVSRSDLVCQLMADATGTPVARTSDPDVTGMGAAYLAGLAIGLWKREDVGVGADQRFSRLGDGAAFVDAYRRGVAAVLAARAIR